MTVVQQPPTAHPGAAAQIPGPIMFVRYAFPPNLHGSCGPADHQTFFAYGAASAVDGGLRSLAQQFAGAYPYLELIAQSTGIADPLDRRVVEAYWVGNTLLDRVGVTHLGDSMEDRFRRRTGLQFPHVADAVRSGGMPHHSFHVFCIYPWVGLLGDDRRFEQALMVLDQCRIRWGTVVSVLPDSLLVKSRPLCFDAGRLYLGDERLETVARTLDGVGLVSEFAVGDTVSMHWDWVCDRVGPRQLDSLRRYTRMHLDMVNDRLEKPGAIIALG